MTQPEDTAGDASDAEEQGSTEDQTGEQSPDAQAKKEGRRRRRKLGQILSEDPITTGTVELMQGDEVPPLSQRMLLFGKNLTADGGPAEELIALVADLTRALKELMPTSKPYLGSLAGANSVEVTFYPPPEEVEEAKRRRQQVTHDPEPVEGVPDTVLAVLALSQIFSMPDPREAALTARSISVTTADRVRDLAVELSDKEVELRLDDVRPEAKATPEWSLRLVEEIDATQDLPAERVTAYGVLQGANSGGEGAFELATDSETPLDPIFGRRRKAGDTLRGSLSPEARKQIKENNLWDRHVEAELDVYRRRRGPSVTVEGIRLISVSARYAEESGSEELPEGEE